MPVGNYTIDEINVGDEVTFLSNSVDTDHSWIVHGKDEKLNKVYIKTSPHAIREDYWTLDIKEIMLVIPISSSRNPVNQ
jgi:hypothetical protein